jgi:GT2 family glycosyltransferase
MDSQAKNRLFAIIVHFNNWPDILDTIADAIREGIDEACIAVIDNGSPAGAPAAAVQTFPNLKWVAGHGNVGYAAAVNIGMREAAEAGAETLLILTHEVRLEPGAVAAMLTLLESSARVAAVGPRLRRKSDSAAVWSEGGNFSRWSCLGAPLLEWKSGPVDWIDGCCFVIRLNALRDLDGIFEPYFLYMEEIDLFQRLARNGFEVLVAEDAFAWQEPGHMGMYLATRNRIMLARRVGVKAATPIVVIEIVLRLVRGVLLHPSRDRQKNSDRWRGLVDGLRVSVTGA